MVYCYCLPTDCPLKFKFPSIITLEFIVTQDLKKFKHFPHFISFTKLPLIPSSSAVNPPTNHNELSNIIVHVQCNAVLCLTQKRYEQKQQHIKAKKKSIQSSGKFDDKKQWSNLHKQFAQSDEIFWKTSHVSNSIRLLFMVDLKCPASESFSGVKKKWKEIE